VNVQLRPGERLTRNWSNRGLHVDMDRGGGPHCLSLKTGEGDLRYAPAYGDLAPGLIGNGVLEYEPPLKERVFLDAAIAAENVDQRPTDRTDVPAIFARDVSRPASLIIGMPTSYVYLTGELLLQTTIGDGGSVEAALSDNNGLDW